MARHNIYKFGGASIENGERIKSVANIIKGSTSPLIVVVSALGKSTNLLELILKCFIDKDINSAKHHYNIFINTHNDIITELSLPHSIIDKLKTELEDIIITSCSGIYDYDYWYDTIVGYGELFSTTILYNYLTSSGNECGFVDAREIIITDNKYREASVDIELTKEAFAQNISKFNKQITITQGFIGATKDGISTTLGREGSDYSAAIFAVVAKSKELTIWKDVEGVLNADPRKFNNTELIPQLNYHDAVELSYSGAQIIHPKTIRPLHNEGITLYVRSFINPERDGSTINSEISTIDTPVITLKEKQILLTITPLDFSFVLEESLENIFNIINNFRQKVNMIQNSAVSISIAVDDSRYFVDFIGELQLHYKVSYNTNLELITIRGDRTTTKVLQVIKEESHKGEIYLSQETRKVVRILRKV